MSESDTQQQTIFGEPLEEQLRIETSGRVIRPWKRMIDQVATEYKMDVTDTGLSVDAVDTSNVIAIFTEIEASAFEAYEITEETTIGVSGDVLGSALQHARYGESSDDVVELTATQEQLESTVHRPLGEADATLSERVSLIDPNSIRECPDLPDLDLNVAVDMEPETFIETVGVLETTDKDHIKIGTNPSEVVFAQETDTNQRNIQLECDPSEVSEFTLFTGSRIGDIATALRNGYVDSVTLRWAEEFPLMVEFEREDVYSGTIMVAPRIKG